MKKSKEVKNLNKMSIIELKDALNRENILLNNKKLINMLPDKGESIKQAIIRIEKELSDRQAISDISEELNKLSVNSDVEKHAEKVISKDKPLTNKGFKPFCTLVKENQLKENSNVKKFMEDCSLSNKATKLISLTESINLLKEQDDRVKKETFKIRQERLFGIQDDSDESSESEKEESDNENNV